MATGIPFPDIDPVALALGPLQIRWYGLAYLAGFLLGWLYAGKLADMDPERRPNREDIDNVLPLLVLGVISIGFFLSAYWMFDRLRDTFAEEV